MFQHCRDCEHEKRDEQKQPCASCKAVIVHNNNGTTGRLSNFKPKASVGVES